MEEQSTIEEAQADVEPAPAAERPVAAAQDEPVAVGEDPVATRSEAEPSAGAAEQRPAAAVEAAAPAIGPSRTEERAAPPRARPDAGAAAEAARAGEPPAEPAQTPRPAGTRPPPPAPVREPTRRPPERVTPVAAATGPVEAVADTGPATESLAPTRSPLFERRAGAPPAGTPPAPERPPSTGTSDDKTVAAGAAAAAPPSAAVRTPAGLRPPLPPLDQSTEPAAPDRAPLAPPRPKKGRGLLQRLTATLRPDQAAPADPEQSASLGAEPTADFELLSSSIEQVSDVLGDQPLEFYERDLPQIAAAETARRVRADVVVLLLDNGEGLLEVSGGVGLTPAERRMNVDYNRDVMRELFRAGVGLVEDTDRVRGALAGIPGSRAETLVMVPLVHERLGFGVLVAGRRRSPNGLPTAVFTDQEVEALMNFADDAAPSLRTAVLLRHLKRQLKPIE